jgi:peptidoglycan hydrolase CwlO-like protein
LGAKPKDVVKQASKNHPQLKKMGKQIEKDLEALRKDSIKLTKDLKDLNSKTDYKTRFKGL